MAVGEKSPDVSMRTVSGLILLSIAGALVFYVLVILASSMTLPREELLRFDLPAAGAFRSSFDSVALGNVVLLAGLLGLITTWNAVFFAGIHRERPYKVIGGIVVPLIAAVSAIGEHFWTADDFPPEWVVLIGWTALGVVLWLASSRRRRCLDQSEQVRALLKTGGESG